MKQIALRDFAVLNPLEMLLMTERRYWIEVVDDNGATKKTDTWTLAVNWFGLIIHRHFLDEPFLIDECVTLLQEDGSLGFHDNKLINAPLNAFLRRIMGKYDDPGFYDYIKQLLYVFHNMVHNYLTIRSEAGVVSATAFDVEFIYSHPLIEDIRYRVKTGITTIADGQKEFDKVMMTNHDFDKSVFALLYRTRGISVIQSFQLLIVRGKVFDLNNVILPKEVKSNYSEGITDLTDSLSDSKGAGYSIISNGAALKSSEWLHKKIHLVTHGVRSIDYQVDCGSTKGVLVKIISEDFKQSMMGKYFFNEEGGVTLLDYDTYDQIEVGKKYRFRSLAYCRVSKNGVPCAVCFGKMASAVPYNPYTGRSAVPGIFYGSTYCEIIGQDILKTKHRIGSAESVPFVVEEQDTKYITTDGDYIFFNKEMIEKDNPYFLLDKETERDFADFKFIEDIDELDSNLLRTYGFIKLRADIDNPMNPEKKSVSYPRIVTNIESRFARMTKDFIMYLKDKEMENDSGLVRVPLKDWDPNKPAFELPYVNEDLDTYRNKVETALKFPNLKDRMDIQVSEEMHGEYMVSFWKTVNERYSGANIIIHDIFLWSCMCVDPLNLDYSMPTADQPRVLVSFHECILNRCVSSALLYGWQSKLLTGKPRNYLIKNRQGGALSCYLYPMTKM